MHSQTLMIHKTHRFHGHGSLQYVYRHGQTVRGPLCALRFVPNTHRDTYRLAVVVSKKVSKSAVVRNRIRRRLYEVVRGLEGRIATPYDMVLTVFTEAMATMPADQLQRAVHAQLKQARIIGATTNDKHQT